MKKIAICTLLMTSFLFTGCEIERSNLRDYGSITDVKIKLEKFDKYGGNIICESKDGEVTKLYLSTDEGFDFYESIRMELKRNNDARFDVIYKFKNDVIVVMSLHE